MTGAAPIETFAGAVSPAGTAAWMLIGIRRMKFPFDDQTPLQSPGVAESREYQARAVVGEAEVGLPSDIVQVTFAGWVGNLPTVCERGQNGGHFYELQSFRA